MSLKKETKSKKKFSKLSQPDVKIVTEERDFNEALSVIDESYTKETEVEENTEEVCVTSSVISPIAKDTAERRRLHFLGYR